MEPCATRLDLLDEAGFTACAFASGEEFLASGRQHECSCLITDIRMPGMSGLDLQCRLEGRAARHLDHLHYRP